MAHRAPVAIPGVGTVAHFCDHCDKPLTWLTYRNRNGSGEFCSNQCLEEFAKEKNNVAKPEKKQSKKVSVGPKAKAVEEPEEVTTVSDEDPFAPEGDDLDEELEDELMEEEATEEELEELEEEEEEPVAKKATVKKAAAPAKKVAPAKAAKKAVAPAKAAKKAVAPAKAAKKAVAPAKAAKKAVAPAKAAKKAAPVKDHPFREGCTKFEIYKTLLDGKVHDRAELNAIADEAGKTRSLTSFVLARLKSDSRFTVVQSEEGVRVARKK